MERRKMVKEEEKGSWGRDGEWKRHERNDRMWEKAEEDK